MEENINTCIMLGMNLDTPLSLGAIFDEKDLKDTGIEFDSHITLLYAPGRELPRKEILPTIKTILAESWPNLEVLMKEKNEFNVFDFFKLDCFENESDYLILKLKEDTELYKLCRSINNGLVEKYDVQTSFASYTPHLTLAELKSGTVGKYLSSETLDAILKDAYLDVEDIFLSYGHDSEEDRLQYFLTGWKSADRFFRVRREKLGYKELIG